MFCAADALAADGQYAVLRLRAYSGNGAMRSEGVIHSGAILSRTYFYVSVLCTVVAQNPLLALPTAILHISILQYLRSL